MITTETLVDEIEEALKASGMRLVKPTGRDVQRVFESEYAVAGVFGFDTCAEIVRGWQDAEERLLSLIRPKLDRQDEKAWDLYLIVATPDAESKRLELDPIRTDTRRVRKVVISAGDAPSSVPLTAFVSRRLAGLTRLPRPRSAQYADPLAEVAARSGQNSPIPTLIEVHQRGSTMMDALQEWIRETGRRASDATH